VQSVGVEVEESLKIDVCREVIGKNAKQKQTRNVKELQKKKWRKH